ncbi:MAG: RNA-guided pseudouridylation complex pseudouridine synthase subunit Cbf5 [Candidatus Nanohaloarchaea archaeon]
MEDARWFTREESEPGEHGTLPEKRSIDELLEKGFFVVDKPFGPTSNQISHWIKEELNRKKAGHFGTLDPNATGVLPVGVDSGTRINRVVSGVEKEYIFEAEMGDTEGIEQVLEDFIGVNTQVPPEKSAVKREERQRELYSAEVLEKEEDRVLARITCESGFYVRVLVEQLGEELGTEAEMNELRRTRQGPIDEEDAATLQEIVDAYHYYLEGDEEPIRNVLHPIEHGITHLRKIVVKDSAVNAVANGANLGASGISKLQGGIKEGETVAIMTLKGELVAVAEAEMSSEKMFDQEGTAAELESVHMDPEKYPRRWKT